jgi:anaerobic magnesium-protoporphyrin IX monomethyl ester cyclase
MKSIDMKVLVLNPPFLPKFSRPQRSPAVTKSGTLYFPIWLAYCAAVLEKDGFEVVLTDAPARDIDLREVVRQAVTYSPRLIVMDTSTPSIRNDIDVAEALKKVIPDSFIVLVGTHVSALPDETLRLSNSIDAVAVREYEFTIRDLARMLADTETGLPIHKERITVHGLCVNTAAGVMQNPDRPYIDNLDVLPWVSTVYKRHLDIRDYFNPNALYPMVTLITSRGCPFRCSFCVYPQTLTGRAYRFRSIQDVLDEVEYVIRAFPDVQSIFFEDDTLTAGKKRCIELADAMIGRNIRISWTANSRFDVDLETMLKIKAAGCRQLCVGFESGDQRILDTMKKGTKRDRMFQFMRDARRAGLLIHGCFMMGFPGETPESIRRTVDLAIQLHPDTVQFYPVMVYPGTDAYREYAQKGWITASDFSRWITPDGLHNCVVRNETLTSAELVRLCDQARRRFYLRPEYFLYKLIQILKKPEDIPRTVKAGAAFFKYLLMGSKV